MSLAAVHNSNHAVVGVPVMPSPVHGAIAHVLREPAQTDRMGGRPFDEGLQRSGQEHDGRAAIIDAYVYEKRGKPQTYAPHPRRRTSLPSAQFLTQQLAQMTDGDGRLGETSIRLNEMASLAYRTAMGEDSTLLGPVTPREIVI